MTFRIFLKKSEPVHFLHRLIDSFGGYRLEKPPFPPEHAGAERTCPVSYGIITYIYAHDNAF